MPSIYAPSVNDLMSSPAVAIALRPMPLHARRLANEQKHLRSCPQTCKLC